jgi:type IV pilus assembly protein PilE
MKRGQRGVTLIELMMVVAIVGILMAIAIPSYRRYVVRANRTDAKVALLQTAANLERCYTNSTPYSYSGTKCTTDVTLPFTVPSGTYVISHVGARAQSTYSLRAAPQGAQATGDAECGSFNLNQLNQQTISGTGVAAKCWKR